MSFIAGAGEEGGVFGDELSALEGGFGDLTPGVGERGSWVDLDLDLVWEKETLWLGFCWTDGWANGCRGNKNVELGGYHCSVGVSCGCGLEDRQESAGERRF